MNFNKYKFAELNFSVFKISDKASDFVSNLSSNDINDSQTAFLDINGKIIATAFQKIIDGDVFLVVAREYAGDLEAHFQKYLRISTTRVEKIESRVFMFVHETTDEYDINKMENGIAIPGGTIKWFSTGPYPDPEYKMKESEFTLFRIRNMLPFQGVDYEHNMLLELNQPLMVSFTKGCYLGQEIIARVSSRGIPPRTIKRLVFVDKPELLSSGGKEAGKITSIAYSEKEKAWLVFAMVDKNIAEIDGVSFYL